MKMLQLGWKHIVAPVLAVLMALGMAACGKQPSAPTNDGVEIEQEDAQIKDQEQTTDQETGTDAGEGTEDIWDLPEDNFEDTVVENPSDDEETADDENPSDDEETSNGETPSGGSFDDDMGIVLPAVEWD